MEQEGIQFLYQVLDTFTPQLFPGNPFHYVIMCLLLFRFVEYVSELEVKQIEYLESINELIQINPKMQNKGTRSSSQ